MLELRGKLEALRRGALGARVHAAAEGAAARGTRASHAGASAARAAQRASLSGPAQKQEPGGGAVGKDRGAEGEGSAGAGAGAGGSGSDSGSDSDACSSDALKMLQAQLTSAQHLLTTDGS